MIRNSQPSEEGWDGTDCPNIVPAHKKRQATTTTTT
jgi:hypothetical protein